MITDTFEHTFLRLLFKTWSEVDSTDVGAAGASSVGGTTEIQPVFVGRTEAANLPDEASDGLTRLAVWVGDQFIFKTRSALAQSGKEVYLVWLDPQLTLDRWDRSGGGLVLRHVLPVSLAPFPNGVPVSPETGRVISQMDDGTFRRSSLSLV